MFLNNSPKDICEQVYWLVKNSQLNFSAQETPYSLNLQIKKKFVNIWQSELQNFQSVSSVHKENGWQPCNETTEAMAQNPSPVPGTGLEPVTWNAGH